MAVVAIVSYNNARIKSRDSKRITDSQTISAALEQYYEENGEYPNSLSCGDGVTNPRISINWCNSKQTGTGGQWIQDFSDTKTLIDFIPTIPVDPINDTPTNTGSMDPNTYFYLAYSSSSATKVQTYYLIITLEDTSNSFVTNNQGVAGNVAPGSGPIITTCLNGSNHYTFNGTGTGTPDGAITLGRNRSDTRVACP